MIRTALMVCFIVAAGFSDSPRAAQARSAPQSSELAMPGMPGTEARLLALADSDRMYRSCRRQVRRAVGFVPRVKFRMPRATPQMIDRCIANGGVYS